MNQQDQKVKSVLDNLIGKTVKTLYLSTDQSLFVVLHNEGYSVYETYGDCCSETWIADLVGVYSLLGHTVVSAEDVYLDEIEDDRSRQDVDRLYGVKLISTGGYFDLIYRNSSNGYYGGDLSREGDYDEYDTADLIEIRKDYSA